MALTASLLLGLLVTPAFSQGLNTTAIFDRTTATITITNSDITVTPDPPGPGPVTFTVVNNSDSPRGVVLSGFDLVGSPILRYSSLVNPGEEAPVGFWLYEGVNYTVKDYTSMSVDRSKTQFTSTLSTAITVPSPNPIGRGPKFDLLTGTISLRNGGILVSPTSSMPGPVMFKVTNTSSKPRGVVISGLDRANSPIIRYSKLLRPGGSAMVSFWLYEGQTYKLQDYTKRLVVGRELKFSSTAATKLTVSSELPAGFGAGPSSSPPPITDMDMDRGDW